MEPAEIPLNNEHYEKFDRLIQGYGYEAAGREMAIAIIEFAKARYYNSPDAELMLAANGQEVPVFQFGTRENPTYIYYEGELTASYGFNPNTRTIIVNRRSDANNAAVYYIETLAREFANGPARLFVTKFSNRLATRILADRNFNSPESAKIVATKLNKMQKDLNISNSRQLKFGVLNSGEATVSRGTQLIGYFSVRRDSMGGLALYVILTQSVANSNNRNSNNSVNADVQSLLDRLTAADRLEEALRPPVQIPRTGGRRTRRA